MLHKWTNEVESLCEKMRINCVNLSEYHRRRYYHFKSYGKYFRLPIIILASINATASVGLQPVLEQPSISGITCFIGMAMGILGSIELYMGIQTSMELELKQSKEFYSLAIDLYKTLRLHPENRGEDGKDYLNKKYSVYSKLCEASNLLKRKLKIDLLTTIPEQFVDTSRTNTPLEIDARGNESKIVLNEQRSILQYICCCVYDADNNTDTYIGGSKSLQLYNFPNLEADIMNSPRFLENRNYDDDRMTDDDIESQYNAYRAQESSKTLVKMGYEPENLLETNSNEAENIEIEQEKVEEKVEEKVQEKVQENVETKEDEKKDE